MITGLSWNISRSSPITRCTDEKGELDKCESDIGPTRLARDGEDDLIIEDVNTGDVCICS